MTSKTRLIMAFYIETHDEIHRGPKKIWQATATRLRAGCTGLSIGSISPFASLPSILPAEAVHWRCVAASLARAVG